MATIGLIPVAASSRAIADDHADDAEDRQEHQIETRLRNAPDLRNNHIDVDVDDGIAVLEGTVDSTQEKREAQRLAHVEGILGVNNRLQVQPAGK